MQLTKKQIAIAFVLALMIMGLGIWIGWGIGNRGNEKNKSYRYVISCEDWGIEYVSEWHEYDGNDNLFSMVYVVPYDGKEHFFKCSIEQKNGLILSGKMLNVSINGVEEGSFYKSYNPENPLTQRGQYAWIFSPVENDESRIGDAVYRRFMFTTQINIIIK